MGARAARESEGEPGRSERGVRGARYVILGFRVPTTSEDKKFDYDIYSG